MCVFFHPDNCVCWALGGRPGHHVSDELRWSVSQPRRQLASPLPRLSELWGKFRTVIRYDGLPEFVLVSN